MWLQSKAENKYIYLHKCTGPLTLHCEGLHGLGTRTDPCVQPPAAKPQQRMGAPWAFTASFQMIEGHTIILMASQYNQLYSRSFIPALGQGHKDKKVKLNRALGSSSKGAALGKQRSPQQNGILVCKSQNLVIDVQN